MSDSRWYTPEARELFRAVLTLETVDECARFLRDLLTEDELAECSSRWRAVQLLDRGLSYREVSKLTGLSTATVTRVAKWWQRGMGGYGFVLERTKRRARLRPVERKDGEGIESEENGAEALGGGVDVRPMVARSKAGTRPVQNGASHGSELRLSPVSELLPEEEPLESEESEGEIRTDGTLERIRPFARKHRSNGKSPAPLV